MSNEAQKRDASHVKLEAQKNGATLIGGKMKYILNSAVMTSYGIWSYRPIKIEEAKQWLLKGGWESTIGYEETAKAMSILFGMDIPGGPAYRKQVFLTRNDKALVFRLKYRVPLHELKGQQGLERILSACEIGILKKLT